MRPIVFVHGFACDHTDWRLQAAHFSAQGCKTFAPDLRGHGSNPAPPEQCSIETFGADVAALLAANDLHDALLVGHSMGCRVVLQASLDAPQRVGALALIDGSHLAGSDPDQAERAAAAAIADQGFERFAHAMFAAMFLGPSPLADAIVARAGRLPAAVGSVLFPRMRRWDTAHMERALAAVRVPMLVAQSTYLNAERRRVPMKPGETTPWLDLVRRLAPRARIEIIPGVGHFPQLEAAETVNKLIAGLV